MLNFEEEMKAVKKGYVVLDIDEYNRLRDEIAAANMRAYEAEQLANRRIAESAASYEELLRNVLSVHKRTHGKDRPIEIVFNAYVVHQLAIEALQRTFSDEELAAYDVKQADDLLLFDHAIAIRKPDIEE